MTNNTINVPRELLENIVLCYNEGEFELGTLAAECQALLSAPSPAGVDGCQHSHSAAPRQPEGETFIGEPLIAKFVVVSRESLQALFRAAGCSGAVENSEVVNAGVRAIDGLRGEVERLQMQLAACGVVALANTIESAGEARQMHPDYMSASCSDVADAVDREIALRTERDQQARRIGELEGLLRSCLPALSDGGCAALANRIDAALAAVCAAAQNIASTSEHSGS